MNGSLLRKSGLLAGLLLAFFIANAQSSGIKFKLQLMPDGQYWGVYAKPTDDLDPSDNTLTGTGQVTIVMPLNYAWSSFTSVSGLWGGNSPSIVNGPSEAPTKSYVTFGFISDSPTIRYHNGVETLLFKFKKDSTCPDELYLLELTDPFVPPNSVSSNPGNELTVFDFGNNLSLHQWAGNYATYAWDCHDTDGDGHLNAHEDTNGNGIFDQGVDASNLYENESAVFGDMLFKLKLMPDGQTWGVYVKPAAGVFPNTNNTIVGSGQVTVVMPKNYAWNTLTSVNGAWIPSAVVDGPSENPTRRYQSFGFTTETTPIPFQAGVETLLFTFKGDGTCPDDIHLIDNQNDPFNHLPNSIGNNPGSEITVFDIITGDVYEYGGNYALHSADCHDNDGDALANALEDTNGNGVFDPQDQSDLNTPDCTILVTSEPTDVVECAGESILFSATATTANGNTNGLNYQWQESTDMGASWNDISNDTVYSGYDSPFLAIGYSFVFNQYCYRLKIWKGNCEPVYTRSACISMEGPMYVTDEPDNTTQCSGEGASFSATVAMIYGDPGTLMYQWEYSTNGGTTWSNVPTAMADAFNGETTTTLSISDVTGMGSWRFRMRYRSPLCDASWTNYATLTVEGPISFTNHPDHKTVCAGNNTNFRVQTQNEGQGNIRYQWQVCMSGDSLTGPWMDLPNNSSYCCASTSNLNISNVADKNGYYYRCLIETAECNSVASYAAVLKVEGSIGITEHPEDVVACAGTSASFSASAAAQTTNGGSLIKQWQVSSDAISYIDITAAGINGYSGWDTDTLHINNVANLNGRRYRLGVSTLTCNDVYSQSAMLTVEGPLTITTHPQDFTNCADEEAIFWTNHDNPGQGELYGKWQMSADNGIIWQDINELVDTVNNNTINFGGYNDPDTLLIAPINGLNGYKFRNVAWTGACDTVISNPATLTVEGPITFTDQPDDVAACAGETVQYTVGVINATGQGDIQYQWQRRTVGGWIDLTNSGPYSGTYTNQLTITPPYSNLVNAKFRCKVKTGNCEWDSSDQANLFSTAPINITSQPQQNFTNCAAENAVFSVQASSINSLSYQWQFSTDGVTWADLSDDANIGGTEFTNTTGSSLDISNLSPQVDGYRFRASISNGCALVYSNATTVNVEGPIEVVLQPTDVSAYEGEEVFFTANSINHGGTYPLDQNLTLTMHRWQVSTDGGATWSNIVGGGNHTGITGNNTGYINYGDTLTISDVTGLNGNMYRIAYTTPTCSEPVYSNPATLTVLDDTIISITGQSEDITTCTGSQTCFSISIEAPAASQVAYIWQKWTPTGWVNVANAANSNQFCPIAEGNEKYRCGARANGGNWVFSDEFNLAVEGPIVFSQLASELDICSNRGIALNMTVQNPGVGQVSLRWQYSKDGGSTWANFPTNMGSVAILGVQNSVQPDAQWQGAFSNNLNITNADGMDGWKFRLAAATPLCEATTDETTLHVLDACQDEACDFDNDGILNEQDGDFNECGSACLKVKLQLLPDGSGWAVMAKPFGGFVPSAANMTQQGRISVIAPSGFNFQGFQSVAGNWLPSTIDNLPGQPGRKCMTFELLSQQGEHIPYQIGEATTLFTFDKAGDCPPFLYLMEQPVPGVAPNLLSGTDTGFAGGFDLCGVYARKAWRCQNHGGGTGGPIIIVTPDHLVPDDPIEIADRDNSIITTEATWFTAAPNPAGDHVNIAISEPLAEGQPRLYLFDLQGKKWQEVAVSEAVTRLELGGLPAGVYFVSLAQNGRVLQREKVVKH